MHQESLLFSCHFARPIRASQTRFSVFDVFLHERLDAGDVVPHDVAVPDEPVEELVPDDSLGEVPRILDALETHHAARGARAVARAEEHEIHLGVVPL